MPLRPMPSTSTRSISKCWKWMESPSPIRTCATRLRSPSGRARVIPTTASRLVSISAIQRSQALCVSLPYSASRGSWHDAQDSSPAKMTRGTDQGGFMRNRILFVLATALLFVAGYLVGNRSATVAYAETPARGTVPKSYGRLVTAIADQIGTGLVFEGSDGVIRFVSITGMKEGELTRN